MYQRKRSRESSLSCFDDCSLDDDCNCDFDLEFEPLILGPTTHRQICIIVSKLFKQGVGGGIVWVYVEFDRSYRLTHNYRNI